MFLVTFLNILFKIFVLSKYVNFKVTNLRLMYLMFLKLYSMSNLLKLR